MARRAIKEFLELAVTDEGTWVKLVLGDGKRLLADFEHGQSKPVRVRVPLPRTDRLLANARHWAKSDDRIGTVKKALERYVRSRERDMYKEVQEIRTCMKRIRQHVLAAEIAQKAIRGLPGTET
jgi:hypothetical protein